MYSRQTGMERFKIPEAILANFIFRWASSVCLMAGVAGVYPPLVPPYQNGCSSKE
jgi:F-box protein